MADISKEDLRKEIAAILKDANLGSTSTKKVRQELEEKLGANLQSRKKEIDDMVMEFVKSKESGEEEEEEDEEEEEEEEDSEDDKKKKRGSTGKKPAAKKAKKAADDSDASEQSDGDSDEEYSPKKAKPAKTRKLPPKKKKGSDSDSDEDYSAGKKKGKSGGAGRKRGGGGYTKALNLSPELAALVGQDTMARHEVVKKVWSIIKEKNLYDPKNKQFAICDDALFKVIGIKRFRTFGMMKYLKNHFVS
ncbi:uncharacterized protein LOC109601718 [Aethina tumida]|uniref:uncharacterized protein LOC109601718 n=1 Tax=Aethina tumida TaxID=116153 RepID=UPI002148E70F|nr:uncharacterized protein LOC109601718 [Aethina tumida]